MVERQLQKGMSSSEIEAFVDYVIGQMSMKEKVAQMSGSSSLLKLAVDMFIFKHYNRKPYPAGGCKRLGIPPIKFSDGPRGVAMDHSTCFPVAIARGASWDPELEQLIGEAIAKEIRALGANYFGGVCINLLRHPAWGRAQETYGEDPYHLGTMGAALVRGVQKHNVMACAKHFACNSIENARFKVDVQIDERTLREVYLPHFRRCVEEGVASVMGAYNKLRGEQCCQSSYLLKKILREEWDFKGFVISDFVFGVKDTLKAVLNGLDIEMPKAKYYGKRLLRAINAGRVSKEVINDSLKRILMTVIRFTYSKDPQTYPRELVSCQEHINLAREAAEKSIVLLKNKYNTLPLSREKIKNLAIIGKLANQANIGDHGSSMVHPLYTISPLEGLVRYIGNSVEISFADGSDLERAEEITARADAVVIVAGYDHNDEGEYIAARPNVGGDRDSLSLHHEDIRMINAIAKKNRYCVVVAVGGSAIMMEEWRNNVSAILISWYSGMEGGMAIARTLFGDVNPSGKLPFTIPKKAEDLPYFDRDADTIEYGYYHGYTLFDRRGIESAFPFGFGLSYTSFTYNHLRVTAKEEMIVLSVEVTNTGKHRGDEVVQLYIGLENTAADRPIKLLKGFRKVSIDPGKKERVTISVPYRELALYNPESASWEIEKMKYNLYVGPSSWKEDLLRAEFTLH